MPSEVVNNCELHVVMFPFLAFGHISPFVQLSNKLFSHGVRVTFLSAASNIPKIRSTLNLNPAITVIPLQFPNGIANTAELPPHLAGNLIHALDLTQDQSTLPFLMLPLLCLQDLMMLKEETSTLRILKSLHLVILKNFNIISLKAFEAMDFMFRQISPDEGELQA
ncbi:hypothetical protein GLYMA_20G196201v4 [Glycine max]|nr:hypothetical protein GLYMA_20G196201v4 [Glycine max]KAH1036982.1 hypothetical protein GYH30_056409 [Glycine max]